MNAEIIISELRYKAVRSSGSGGQHVNKVATKVLLYFNVEASKGLSEEEKSKLQVFLKNRLNQKGELILASGESRSQYRNKQLVTQRCFDILSDGLKTEKHRIPTKIPKAVTKKRLENKRRQSQKKSNRKKPDLD